jgi:hypothetical protein
MTFADRVFESYFCKLEPKADVDWPVLRLVDNGQDESNGCTPYHKSTENSGNYINYRAWV